MGESAKKLRKNLFFALVVFTTLTALVSAWFWGFLGAAVSTVTALCLALGFWLTENLVGVMTGVKKANQTAVGLLFLGKLGWWAMLFWFSRNYPAGAELAIAAGIGGFLLALLVAAIGHFGWPKISDGKAPGEP